MSDGTNEPVEKMQLQMEESQPLGMDSENGQLLNLHRVIIIIVYIITERSDKSETENSGDRCVLQLSHICVQTCRE